MPVAALTFVGLFALGGVADIPVGTVAATMAGIHVLIGLGEAAITVVVLGAVLAVRPDLVHGAPTYGSCAAAPRPDDRRAPVTRRRRTTGFLLVGLLPRS